MNYDDMLKLQYTGTKRQPHMSLYNRAAQFAPFAALTGFEELSSETAQSVELREDHTETLDIEIC